MATETLQPTGLGSPDTWGDALVGAATKYEACQTPDDDDTSYIHSSTTPDGQQVFITTPSSIQTGDTVTQVVIRARWKIAVTNPPEGVIGYSFSIAGGGTQSGTSTTFGPLTSSYQTDTYTHSGLSVAWDGDFTMFAQNTLANRIRLTSLTAEITYTPAARPGIYYAMMNQN